MEKYRLLFESVFKKNLTDDDAVSHLEKLTAEHPYFSIAQFYLLQLTAKDNSTYNIQAKKAAALFNNNYWLNFQLLEAGVPNGKASYDKPVTNNNEIEKVVPVIDEVALEATEQFIETTSPEEIETPVTNTADESDKIVMSQDEIKEENNIEHQLATEEVKEEPVINEQAKETETPVTNTTDENDKVVMSQDEIKEDNDIEHQLATEEVKEEPVINEQATSAIETPVTNTTDESGKVVMSQDEIKEDNNIEHQLATEEVKEEPVINEQAEETKIPVTGIADENNEAIIAPEETKEEEIVPEPVIETEVVDIETVSENVVGDPPNEEVKPLPVIAEPAKEEQLLFEPLHTSDYFASVGIKLSEEEKTGDKLGKQLKSFTDWLKTMKKVHASELAAAIKPAAVVTAAAEGSIQILAEKSNEENDVITEAMADVLVQQDRRDKAIEILEKLSLLNPSKSTYFAAKINQIKEV